MSRWLTVASLLLFLTLPSRSSAQGTYVESIELGSVGERIGLHVGDRLVKWVRRSAPTADVIERGTFTSPFDVKTFELETAQRTHVSVHVARQSASSWLRLVPGRWGVKTTPVFAEPAQTEFQRGLEFAGAGKVEDALSAWRTLSTKLRPANPILACWLLSRIGELLDRVDRVEEAKHALVEAVEVVRPLERPAIEAQLLFARALIDTSRGRDTDEARDVLRQSADLWERATGRGLGWAWAYSRYADRLDRPGPDSASSVAFREILAIQRRLSGEGHFTGQTYNRLGANYFRAGDLAAAQEYWEKARVIQARVAPMSGDHASALNNLAIVAIRRGNLARGEQLLEQADRIDRAGSAGARHQGRSAMGIMNQGIVAYRRGDLARAEELYLQALAIGLEDNPENGGTAGIMHNLGMLALDRGDRDTAEVWFNRTFEIWRKQAKPGTLEYASVLGNQRDSLKRAGALTEAESLAREVVDISTQKAPNTGIVASALANLAEVQLARHRYAEARASLEQALAIPALAATAYEKSEYLHLLAQSEHALGDFQLAEDHARESIALRVAQSPHDVKLASAFRTLGLALRDQKRFGESLIALQQAIAFVERQRTRLGISDDTADAFSAMVADTYRDCIDLLVRVGSPAGAFDMLERSRARAFLRRLAERDMMFARDIPESLRSERIYVEDDLRRTRQQLDDAGPAAGPATIKRIEADLALFQARLRGVEQRIKQTSPSLAALEYPTPLTLAAARRALPSGTLLLSYSVGQDRTWLFALQSPTDSTATPSGLTVIPVDVSRDQLQQMVTSLVTRLKTRPTDDAASALAATQAPAAVLYGQLMRPVESLIANAKRLVVIGDGPLHSVPFGALVTGRPGNEGYLAFWRPTSVVASMTVYSQVQAKSLTTLRGSELPLEVAAFGDPRYPSLESKKRSTRELAPLDLAASSEPVDQSAPDKEVGAAVRAGLSFDALPATRGEVLAIAELYRPGATAYFGEQATEQRVKQLRRNTRIVHFAVHALINHRSPLNSALALSIPERVEAGQDNGLLQAWEILEQVRIDADLVTLSACETAVGQDAGGEGLLSLTRAFHHAGARTVLASLWRVDDQATAELMKQFYTHLRAGKTKGQALQAAQRIIATNRSWVHPYYWAAFQLSGAID